MKTELAPGVTVVERGVQLILDGQLWTVDALMGTELVMSRPGKGGSQSVSRSMTWSRVTAVKGAQAVTYLDANAARQWAEWGPSDRLRWFFRLCVVNLVLTGYRLGHEAFAGDGEPLLPPAGPNGALTESIKARAEAVAHLLATRRDLDWIVEMLVAARGEEPDDKPSLPLNDRIPSVRAIQRWVKAVEDEGVFALRDGRRGRSGGKEGDRLRRKVTEELVEEVVTSKKTSSKLMAETHLKDVERLARDRGLDILRRTTVLEIIGAAMRRYGQTPAQKKSILLNDTRFTRANTRMAYPGALLAWDATWADNLVTLTIGGKPFRPWIIAIWDVATGIILGIWATGHYRQIDVQMVLHDACRPMLVTPPGFQIPPRIKGHPRIIEAWSERAWEPIRSWVKPGAIPRTVRADNARQHSGADLMASLRSLRIDLSPSRKGRSTDNPNAESGFAALRSFSESQPCFTGNTTQNRGALDEVPLLLSQFNAKLQRFAFVEHNFAPSAAPFAGLVGGSGLTRMQHWDAIVEATGAMPVLTDPTARFLFMPQTTCTRTQKGIRLNRQAYSDPVLFEFGRNVVDQDQHVRVHFDPRDESCVWVHNSEDDNYYEIPNVLRQHTRHPLTNNILTAALRLAHLNNAHNRNHDALIADRIDDVDLSEMGIRRDLTDLAHARFTLDEVVRDGARIVPSSQTVDLGTERSTYDPYAPLPRMEVRA